MLFKRPFHAGIVAGTTTLTFRRWSRPLARAGGRHRLGANGALVIVSVDRVRTRDITPSDARRAGYSHLAALIADLSRREPSRQGAEVYRVAFRFVAQEDSRARLARSSRLTDQEVQALRMKLQRMDRLSTRGAWTMTTLALIERHPRVAAAKLAERLGRELRTFKADVRKLKALGLTISREVGYEIAPRGRALLRRLAN